MQKNNLKKIVLGLLFFGGVALVLCGLFQYNRGMNTDKILAHSALKNKTFASEVQQIKVGGMSAYLLEEHSNPIIALSFVFERAGSAYEPENRQGLANLLAEMLLHGAGKYDAVMFSDVAEEYGIKIGFTTSADDMSGYLQMPTAGKDKAVELLTSALYQPHFAYDYMALTKKQMQTALRNRQEKPEGILADKFSEIIFTGHPYARPNIGLPHTIDAVTRNDLRQFMYQHFTRKNIIIGIAGDINATEAKQLIKDLFGRLPADFSEQSVADVTINSNGTEHWVEHDFAQTITSFAALGTRRNSADFYPLYIANYIFGDSGLNSRISKVVREKEGLTYGIYTYLVTKDTSPMLAGGYSSTPQNFTKAKALLLQEWQKMGQKGVTKEELKQAKEALIAAHNLRFASIGGIADMLTAMQQYHLGIDFLERRNDYVRKVTLEEVNTAAEKYFGTFPDFVIVGLRESKNKEK